MKRLHGLTLVGGVLGVLVGVADASAEIYSQQTTLVWPGFEGSARVDVPTDTRLWFLSDYVDLPVIALEGPDGAAVPFDLERIELAVDGGGYARQHIALTPRDLLAPNTTYTVRVVNEEQGSDEDPPTLPVPFTTGDGPMGSTALEAAELEFVAIEGLDLSGSGCCQGTEYQTDTLHSVSWRTTPGSPMYRAVLTVEHPGSPPRTRVRLGDYARIPAGDYSSIADRSFGETSYPCVTFELMDILGRVVASESRCAPDICVRRPEDVAPFDPWVDFTASASPWTEHEAACLLAPDAPEDEQPSGCASTPTSPPPTTPCVLLALGLFAVTRRRPQRPS